MRAGTTRRRHTGAIMAGLLAATMVLAAAPVGASHGGTHKLVNEEYFFQGEATDQALKVGGSGPTFSQDAPAGSTPAVQSTSVVTGAPGVGEAAAPLLAYWTGDFSGAVTGNLELTLFSGSPYFSHVAIRVYGDPGGNKTLLGELADVNLSPGFDVPAEVTVSVPVTGVVQSELRIEIQKQIAWEPESPIFYGTAEYPSGFVLPTLVPCEANDSDPSCG